MRNLALMLMLWGIGAVPTTAAAQSDLECLAVGQNGTLCPGDTNPWIRRVVFWNPYLPTPADLSGIDTIVIGRWPNSTPDAAFRNHVGACVNGVPTRLYQPSSSTFLTGGLPLPSYICTDGAPSGAGASDTVTVVASGSTGYCGSWPMEGFVYNGYQLMLYTMHGADTVQGGSGDELVCSGQGIDTVRGGSGIDIIHGMSEDDRLQGQGGQDGLYGGPGNDRIYESMSDAVVDTLMGESGTTDCVQDLSTGGSPASVNCACYDGSGGGGTSSNTGAGVTNCTYSPLLCTW